MDREQRYAIQLFDSVVTIAKTGVVWTGPTAIVINDKRENQTLKLMNIITLKVENCTWSW